MSDKVHISVGTPEDMGRRFVDAWKRAERGEHVQEEHLTFRDLESLLATLTPKRLELLRYVRHHPAANVKALAVQLRRDYKNVHQDVEALASAGLICKTDAGVEVPYTGVDASLAF